MELSSLVGIFIFFGLLVVLGVAAIIWRIKLKRAEARRWNRSNRSTDSTDK